MTQPETVRKIRPTGRHVASELTAAGRGAISVIGISGNQLQHSLANWFRAFNKRPLSEQETDKPIYGYWNSEDVIVCFQGEDYAEVHCHGGAIARKRILKDLEEGGFNIQLWNETPTVDSTAAQALKLLPQATTLKVAAILTWQSEGALDQAFELIEAKNKQGSTDELQSLVEQLLSFASVGMHLVQPWTVAIVGAPNVGKSSLINRIVGYDRSIVFDQPGTTRDRVSVEAAIDGWPIKLIDTAGIREAVDKIEKVGVGLAEQAIAEADLVIEVFDATELDRQGDSSMVGNQANRIAIANKADLVGDQSESNNLMLTSATTGLGMDELLKRIAESLVPQTPRQGQAVPFLEEHVSRLNSY